MILPLKCNEMAFSLSGKFKLQSFKYDIDCKVHLSKLGVPIKKQNRCIHFTFRYTDKNNSSLTLVKNLMKNTVGMLSYMMFETMHVNIEYS